MLSKGYSRRWLGHMGCWWAQKREQRPKPLQRSKRCSGVCGKAWFGDDAVQRGVACSSHSGTSCGSCAEPARLHRHGNACVRAGLCSWSVAWSPVCEHFSPKSCHHVAKDYYCVYPLINWQRDPKSPMDLPPWLFQLLLLWREALVYTEDGISCCGACNAAAGVAQRDLSWEEAVHFLCDNVMVLSYSII